MCAASIEQLEQMFAATSIAEGPSQQQQREIEITNQYGTMMAHLPLTSQDRAVACLAAAFAYNNNRSYLYMAHALSDMRTHIFNIPLPEQEPFFIARINNLSQNAFNEGDGEKAFNLIETTVDLAFTLEASNDIRAGVLFTAFNLAIKWASLDIPTADKIMNLIPPYLEEIDHRSAAMLNGRLLSLHNAR